MNVINMQAEVRYHHCVRVRLCLCLKFYRFLLVIMPDTRLETRAVGDPKLMIQKTMAMLTRNAEN